MGLIVKIGANIQDFDRQMRRLTRDVNSVGDKLKSVGTKLSTAVTLPILAIGASAIKTGSEFEASMSKVAAISGAVGEDLAALEEQARQLGSTTKFSASEAAAGMQYLAMAGFETKDILSAMPGLLNLAAAGAMELGDAADIASNIMSGFGIEAENAGHISDVLAKAASSANTDVAQLGEAMKYLAPTANTMGWSMEEATAAVMAMSDAGIQGSLAGQAFGSSLGRLAKPTAKMQSVLDETGMAFFDAEGNMKSMSEVIAEVEKGTEGMTAQQKSATLSTLFGAEAYKHWAVLLDKGSTSLAENTEMLVNADGAAQQMAETMSDNLAGRVQALKSAFEEMGIVIFDALQPALEAIVGAVQGLLNWFNNLDPSIQNLIIALAGFAAAIGPILVAVGVGITLFGQLQAALAILGTGFAAIAAPIAIAIAAVAAIIAIFVLFWDEIKAGYKKYFKPTIDSLVKYVKSVLVPVFEKGFETLQVIVKDAFEIIKRLWNEILWPVLKFIISFVKDKLVPIWKVQFEAIAEVVKSIFGSIKDLWTNSLKPILNGIIDFISGVFTGNWSKAWQGVVKIFGGIWEGLKTLAKAPLNAVIALANKAIGGLNKISINIPDWVPVYGGQNFGLSIPKIPMLAKGGHVFGSGAAIVGEAGPELLQKSGSGVRVTPLTTGEKARGVGSGITQNITIHSPEPLKPSDIARKNLLVSRQLAMEWGL